MTNFNAHLEEDKFLVNSEREEFLLALPLHKRYQNLTYKELVLLITANLEQHYFMANSILDSMGDHILEQFPEELIKQAEQYIIYKTQDELNMDAEKIQLDDLDLAELEKEHDVTRRSSPNVAQVLLILQYSLSQKGYKEVLKHFYSLDWDEQTLDTDLDWLITMLANFKTGFDYYNSEIEKTDFMNFMIKNLVDHAFMNIHFIQAATGFDEEGLVKVAQYSSLFNLYLLRNYLELAEYGKHLSTAEFQQEAVFNTEVDRQWEIYRLVRMVSAENISEYLQQVAAQNKSGKASLVERIGPKLFYQPKNKQKGKEKLKLKDLTENLSKFNRRTFEQVLDLLNK